MPSCVWRSRRSAVAAFLQRREEEKLAGGHLSATKSTLNVKKLMYNNLSADDDKFSSSVNDDMLKFLC